ncbi:protein rep [Levilactobacillus brevis]
MKKEHDGSYNQHLHVLLFVRSSYFKSSDSYINQEEWTRLWQKGVKKSIMSVLQSETHDVMKVTCKCAIVLYFDNDKIQNISSKFKAHLHSK